MAALDNLIDGHILKDVLESAVSAITKFIGKKHAVQEDTSILGAQEERISLSFTKKRIKTRTDIDPHVITLKHPTIDPRKTQICLIVKDPQREYKNLLESLNIKFIGRVVGISKLKGKWKGFEERRQLLRENGLFLVDDRVSALMPNLLGKMWYKAKKQPLPVNMKHPDLKKHLERAVNNTFMNENAGQTVTIRVANTSHTRQQIVENVVAAIPQVIKRTEGGWDNVQSVYLTVIGASLPLWSCALGAGPGERWDGMTKVETVWGGIETSGGDSGVSGGGTVDLQKGKKRTGTVNDDGSELPKRSRLTVEEAEAVKPVKTSSEVASKKAKVLTSRKAGKGLGRGPKAALIGRTSKINA